MFKNIQRLSMRAKRPAEGICQLHSYKTPSCLSILQTVLKIMLPAVIGATLPGSESAQFTLRPSLSAASKSTRRVLLQDR
jgi:hypothetical protein